MITKEERGKQSSIDDLAHKRVALGILMKRYRNVSKVDLPLSSYDLVIVPIDKNFDERFVRCQVKTARKQISFVGGSRGGVGRTYKSGVKVFKQSTKTADVIVGVSPTSDGRFDLFFVPTILVERLKQRGISTSRIQGLKNNFEMLERCTDAKYVIGRCREMGII